MLINFNKKTFNKQYIAKIHEAYDYAVKILQIPCHDLEININFVSGREIKELNGKFRNKNTETDVLSFPNLLDPEKENMQLIANTLTRDRYYREVSPDTNCIFLGDICICKRVVFQHAKEYGNSKLREMAYMAVHGLLHLLGYDHIIENEKKIMRDMEEKIMSHVNLERV